MERAHAYKDAEAKGVEVSMGTFNYPVLMAADILLYSPDIVPVGLDQKQHIEYARDIADKFNFKFGEVFKLPQEKIVTDLATVPGIDGRKMSKSYNNYIPLFATDEEIEKLVMSIVTDSSGDVPTNVYAIHRLLKSEAELAPLYEANKGKYKALKDALIADLKAFIAPLRARRAEFEANPEIVAETLRNGKIKAKEVADKKLHEVKVNIGVTS
jgi:tryptophanyl-tRNA synthetase